MTSPTNNNQFVLTRTTVKTLIVRDGRTSISTRVTEISNPLLHRLHEARNLPPLKRPREVEATSQRKKARANEAGLQIKGSKFLAEVLGCSPEDAPDGLYAGADGIKKGGFVCYYEGEVLSSYSDYLARVPDSDMFGACDAASYQYQIDEVRKDVGSRTIWIDPTRLLAQGEAPFGSKANHSPEANTYFATVRQPSGPSKVAIHATRDIAPGEEITVWYGPASDRRLRENVPAYNTWCLKKDKAPLLAAKPQLPNLLQWHRYKEPLKKLLGPEANPILLQQLETNPKWTDVSFLGTALRGNAKQTFHDKMQIAICDWLALCLLRHTLRPCARTASAQTAYEESASYLPLYLKRTQEAFAEAQKVAPKESKQQHYAFWFLERSLTEEAASIPSIEEVLAIAEALLNDANILIGEEICSQEVATDPKKRETSNYLIKTKAELARDAKRYSFCLERYCHLMSSLPHEAMTSLVYENEVTLRNLSDAGWRLAEYYFDCEKNYKKAAGYLGESLQWTKHWWWRLLDLKQDTTDACEEYARNTLRVAFDKSPERFKKHYEHVLNLARKAYVDGITGKCPTLLAHALSIVLALGVDEDFRKADPKAYFSLYVFKIEIMIEVAILSNKRKDIDLVCKLTNDLQIDFPAIRNEATKVAKEQKRLIAIIEKELKVKI